jgi:site-specific DNA-methyltransferase (adenine-specific)
MRVLDNCAGSGTTGAACIELGREFILIEKDKTYFNEIILPRLGQVLAAQNSAIFVE